MLHRHPCNGKKLHIYIFKYGQTGYDRLTATFSVLFSISQSLSDGVEAIVSLRGTGPLLDCPNPLFGRSAVDSVSGSCCGAVARNRTKVA